MKRVTIIAWAALAAAFAWPSAAAAADNADETTGPPCIIVGRVDTPRGTSITMENGLRYMDLKVGSGPTVTSASTVQIHYKGTLVASGRQFDSSRDRIIPSPLKFTVGGGAVVKGMELGIQGMRKDGVRLLEVPSALGYGSKGRAPAIGPDSDLLFEMQLVNIK